jgi:hypothetical protein
MGTSADAANVGYHVSFADQGKQTSVFRYSVFRIYILPFYEKIKRKTEDQMISLIRLPFAHLSNKSLSFVHLFTEKQTVVIRLQTD